MRDGADLREYFTLLESTQVDRRTLREAYAATIKPLLNTACCRVVCRLSAEIQNSYSMIKKILLEQADSRNDATIQQFWEHRKTKTDTWQEELAELLKLAHRCAPSNDGEAVREIFVMEQMIQQLPRTIQQFVRERKPTKPEQALEHIVTYFRTRGLDEQGWEHSGAKQVISPSPGIANLSKSTSTSTRTESSTTSGSDARQNKDNRQSQTYNNYFRPRRDPKDIQCYNCKQMGHYAWQCVKVNVVALPGFDSKTKPPVMKQGEAEHL